MTCGWCGSEKHAGRDCRKAAGAETLCKPLNDIMERLAEEPNPYKRLTLRAEYVKHLKLAQS